MYLILRPRPRRLGDGPFGTKDVWWLCPLPARAVSCATGIKISLWLLAAAEGTIGFRRLYNITAHCRLQLPSGLGPAATAALQVADAGTGHMSLWL
jgi:hypothetical protein